MFAKELLSNGLLRICRLVADVVSLFVSRSLPTNGSTRYNISKELKWQVMESTRICSALKEHQYMPWNYSLSKIQCSIIVEIFLILLLPAVGLLKLGVNYCGM
jgi:hypothetical protein